jgi:sugar-specific transcriptional regulator TrmB
MIEPRKNLIDLGLSESEVTVYLALVGGAHTARDLIKITRLKRPTVYYALGCLEKRGLLSKTGLEGDKRLTLEPIEKLSVIADQKALEASRLQKDILGLIPSLTEKSAPANQKPAVAFYEGVDAVKNAIMEMLYCKNKHISSISPKQNFFWQVGPDFVELFIDERIKRNIKTKSLWEAPIQKNLLQKYYEGHSQVRILPEVMHSKFKTSFFIYDDKTLCVSSMANCYCIVITSKEYAETMRAWFDGLWEVSHPHAR